MPKNCPVIRMDHSAAGAEMFPLQTGREVIAFNSTGSGWCFCHTFNVFPRCEQLGTGIFIDKRNCNVRRSKPQAQSVRIEDYLGQCHRYHKVRRETHPEVGTLDTPSVIGGGLDEQSQGRDQ